MRTITTARRGHLNVTPEDGELIFWLDIAADSYHRGTEALSLEKRGDNDTVVIFTSI
ncbi:MAG TPA: hypothetical protein VMR08_03710 [Patescibacteria group bacterium]|jgi:hypothetical protein|nr:hypothetical protein [Patescibacteria group bacterium]